MNNISKTKQFVLSMIDSVREQVLNDCDDETLISRMSDLNILDADAFHEDDYYTYDEAIAELGIAYNRNKLSDLAKKHGIRNRKFKNVSVGFHKDDIRKLKLILNRGNKGSK